MEKGKNNTYDDLYLTILQIGRDSVEGGLSIIQLKKELEQRGYDMENTCIEYAVTHWFLYSFAHYDNLECEFKAHCLSDLKDHEDCGFILTGQSCLALMEYENSCRNNKYARYAIIIAAISVLISILLCTFN